MVSAESIDVLICLALPVCARTDIATMVCRLLVDRLSATKERYAQNNWSGKNWVYEDLPTRYHVSEVLTADNNSSNSGL